MSRTRNAYEIRLETLCLARDILSDNRDTFSDGGSTVEMQAASGYTVDDVITEAGKLYAFVAPPEHEAGQ